MGFFDQLYVPEKDPAKHELCGSRSPGNPLGKPQDCTYSPPFKCEECKFSPLATGRRGKDPRAKRYRLTVVK